MTLAPLRRLTNMQPGELRFRMTCELRKTVSRLRAAVSLPRWDRAHLAPLLAHDGSSTAWSAAIAALRAGDYAAAHAALARHFVQRASPFPVIARDVRSDADAIVCDFPDAPADAVRRADAILQGHSDLLGYTGLATGSPDWHRDPVHLRRSPKVFWAAVPYLDPVAGDHKIIWELNRHQHWLMLGRAYHLSGDRRYYAEFTGQIASWLADNPPLIGTNWASMLELAFRSLSWLWALELFVRAATADDRAPWLVDLLLALDRQLRHIEHNLSHYFSPNTHLTGEALALYVAGLALPELRASARRTAVGRGVLVREATRQIRSDGGHAELSTHYHRYSTDFYLLATTVARRAGDPAASVFEQAARAQARYMRTMTDDQGIHPQIGDDDGGLLLPICGRSPADCRDTLATAAVLLSEPALATGPPPEETYWMCGAAARRAASAPVARWTSAALTASGYFVSRTPRGDHLVFDAGPHGFLNGGHAHADALSCTLSVDERPLLIDPGTALYTMDPQIRDRFRSTMMHNTVAVGGRSQSEPCGAFHWKSVARAHASIWRTSSGCDYVEGTHDGYAPLRHTRGILAIHGLGWWIVDHILGTGTTAVEGYWHVHPSWECSASGSHVCRVRSDAATLALATSAPHSVLSPGSDPLAAWSPVYGIIEPAPVIRVKASASLPTSIATFIAAAGDVAADLMIEPLTVRVAPGSNWHGCACRVRWTGGAMTMLAAVEASGVATRDSAAPPDRWGTAELQTDARTAVIIDRVTGPSEAVLVNGALVTSQRTHQLVSLSRPVPLLRLPTSSVAPNMHGVGAAPIGSER
ncbi:MAG: alginate lyase family protein [Vicinamibacterales bacterium]